MKRLLLIAAICCFTLAAPYAQAQLFTPFKARGPITQVMERAGQSMSSPQLIAVATADFSFDAGGIPVSSEFDFESGTAVGWMYVIQEENNTDFRIQLLAAKLAIGGVWQIIDAADVDAGIPDDFFDHVQAPMTADWIDSDVLAANLRAHMDVQQFISAHPGLKPTVLGCWSEPERFDLTIWTSYIGEFSGSFEIPEDQPGLVCETSAVNGETTCQEISVPTDVDEELEDVAVQLGPNPAQDFVTVYIAPSISTKAERVNIIDINGRSVATTGLRGAQAYIPMQVAGLASGVYTVQIIDGAGRVLAHSMMLRR